MATERLIIVAEHVNGKPEIEEKRKRTAQRLFFVCENVAGKTSISVNLIQLILKT